MLPATILAECDAPPRPPGIFTTTAIAFFFLGGKLPNECGRQEMLKPPHETMGDHRDDPGVHAQHVSAEQATRAVLKFWTKSQWFEQTQTVEALT